MDGASGGSIDGEEEQGSVDPCRSRWEKININDMQIFSTPPEQSSNAKFRPEQNPEGSKPAEGESVGVRRGGSDRGPSDNGEAREKQDNKHFEAPDDIDRSASSSELHSTMTQMLPPCVKEASSECSDPAARCDPFARPGSKSPSDDEDSEAGHVCARTYLTYDRTKRQCPDKISVAPLKNNEHGSQTVNKRKKTTPQKAMYHLQSLPPDDRHESYWPDDKNFSRLQTPIVTCSQKTNGASGSSAESKSNGCSASTKAGKRCAETYLSSAHLWPSTQGIRSNLSRSDGYKKRGRILILGSSLEPDSSQLEPGWLSAYYANLFFSSFPLMFQNHSSIFPYPFLPSFPPNFPQQTSPPSRPGSSSLPLKKSSLAARSDPANKISDKNLSCDPHKTNSIKLNSSESNPMSRFPGDSPTSFWSHARLEDAAQELKRKYQSHNTSDLKALDLSKSGYNRKSRKPPCSSRSNFDVSDNGNSILNPLHHSVFSEFMKSSIMPKLTPPTDSVPKEMRDYCKNYNGNNSIKKSLYDNRTNYANSKSHSYTKSLSTHMTSNLGWMSNDLLLQPPLLPSLSFLKWTPEELSEYVEKIDGCVDTAKALRSRGINGSQLPMLTLDIMTQELGLSMTSAQNLMNIVRNLLSTTLPGEPL